MNTRQAKTLFPSLLALLVLFSACSPLNTPVPATPTKLRPTASPVPTLFPTLTPIPTYTPLACLTQPGRIEQGAIETFRPTQKFMVYLPPCYDEKTDERYPVLYLLHGQTYTDDQWIRLGVPQVLDRLIHSGEVKPFIVVFPDDRYWNLQAGPGFGDRLVNHVIPYIDETYRTLPDRQHRAIGGMSRGAGWSLRLGLSQWKLFGAIGLHSLAVMQKDASRIGGWLGAIPVALRPNIFMDIGDNDQELSMAKQVEAMFTEADVPHEWRLYSGDHTEKYWGAHVQEYLRWYAEQWKDEQ